MTNCGMSPTHLVYHPPEIIFSVLYLPTHPFLDFMEMISLQGKANFFESRVSSYAKSGVNQSVGSSSDHQAIKKGFSLDEDF